MYALPKEGIPLILLVFALLSGCVSSEPAESRTTAAAPLENTHWKLLEVGGRPARVGGDGAEPYFQLDPAQKRAVGGTGCNQFFGLYELRGDTLRFDQLASTRRACLDPELSRQETAFLGALGATRTWKIRGDTLVLRGEPGQVARFKAQQAQKAAPGVGP